MIPTLEERHEATDVLLGTLGYGDDMIRHEFPVWVDKQVRRIDTAAFTRSAGEPQDQTSSAIAGFHSAQNGGIQEAFDAAAALAAPVVIFAGDSALELWSVGASAQRERLHSLAYEDVQAPPDALARELAPRNLLAAKQATYQQSLFPTDVAGLLKEARDKSAGRLTQLVELTAAHLGAGSPSAGWADRQQELTRISRLLIGAMAALMVSDKVLVDRDGRPETVLARAQQRFQNYFAWTVDLEPADQESLLSAIEELGRDVSYAGLDPTVVASVYECAMLDAATRAKFGVFYTPPSLARTMLAHVPLEELRPETRAVLDPSCGSGTFLLAAYDRLRQIAPLGLDLMQAHQDTGRRLTGFDVDPLAVEVARLALLLNAMPATNGWRVEQRDALAAGPALSASLVVSNPPWRDIRSHHGQRVQTADEFVHRMVESVAPGGFLAVVLPAGWLASGTSRATREMLGERCSIFEVWRLPQDTFSGADVDAAVLFARRDHREGRYVFRRVRRRPDWRSRFLESGAPADETYLAQPDGGLKNGVWLHGPLDRYHKRLGQLPRLGSIAYVGKGPVPTPPVGERGGSGPFLWLRKMTGTRAYAPVDPGLLTRVRYPQEFNWRPDDGSRYLRPKVIVSGVRNPDIVWRLKVLPDLEGGIIPRDSMSVVIPEHADKDLVYALCAVLGSSLASCWIDTLNAGRSITVAMLEGLPIPAPGGVWGKLARAGERAVSEAARGTLSSEELVAIDRLVVDAYGLPFQAFTVLAEHFAGVTAPEDAERYPPTHDVGCKKQDQEQEAISRTFGTVLELVEDRMKIWISGVTSEDGEWVEVPASFPGSQLQPGATFKVEIAGRNIAHARFTYQSESYLDLDELIRGPEVPA